MKNKLEEIGSRFLFVRKSKNMTQAEMAEILDVTTRTYQHYENGETEMGILTALRACEILEASPMFLIFGEDIHAKRMQKLLTAQDNTTFKINNSGGRLNVTISVPVLPELEGL